MLKIDLDLRPEEDDSQALANLQVVSILHIYDSLSKEYEVRGALACWAAYPLT
jgi:hypothetical protein